MHFTSFVGVGRIEDTDMNFETTSPALDDLMLDIATSIELSDHDWQIADSRYRQLKDHLEASGSPLAEFVADEKGHIYAQGSMATGTTIVSGDNDDRFDVDAIVEFDVPSSWSSKTVLDLLFEALADFPDAEDIERCTRCVQIQFATMHLDVTVLDPHQGNRVERSGDIFHSPDDGSSMRVSANPFGFGQWYRANVIPGDTMFNETISKRRTSGAVNRLNSAQVVEKAEQDDLLGPIPPRVDSQQSIALKLLKRNLSLRYKDRNTRRPPSIYLAKLAVDIGQNQNGLCAQLSDLVIHIEEQLEMCIDSGVFPDERNPSLPADRLNDRWPENQSDLRLLQNDLKYLRRELLKARTSEFKDVAAILSGLFGERIGKKAVVEFLDRDEANASGGGRVYERGTGVVLPKAAIVAPAVVRSTMRENNFHAEVIKSDE